MTQNAMSVRQWQERYRTGAFHSKEVAVQREAGWWNWHCRDDALAGRLARIAPVIMGLKEPALLDEFTVWFINEVGRDKLVYDSVRFEPLAGPRDDAKFFKVDFCGLDEPDRWTLYTGRFSLHAPEFGCGHVHDMTKYIDKLGQELKQGIRPAFLDEKAAAVEDSNVVRLLGAGADQVLDIQTADTVLTAYVQTLVNRYILLNHMDREQDCRAELCVGDFKIDLMRRQVFLKEERIELSGKEFDLLLFFAQNPNRVLTEAQIYDRVWHTDKDFHSSIAKPINRLRQKIEPDQRNPVYIRSIRGVGYQFVPNIVTSCDI